MFFYQRTSAAAVYMFVRVCKAAAAAAVYNPVCVCVCIIGNYYDRCLCEALGVQRNARFCFFPFFDYIKLHTCTR